MQVVVVLPTYNERANIGAMIDALDTQRDRVGAALAVLVVDDHSPDGTADAVKSLADRYAHVHLLQGVKRGLGSAYIRGMRHAMDELEADVVVQMDADRSHDPGDLPRLLEALDADADFVIGSRYVEGGSVPRQWGRPRKTLSFVGNLMARYVAGLHRVRDCTAGFRAMRTTLLRRIDLAALRVQGYAFQVALLHAATLESARVREIPVAFVDRTRGRSKLGFRDIVEFAGNVWAIRLRSWRTFMKFLLVGASGVLVNLAAFSALLVAGLHKYLASPLAIELSIVSNFLLNDYWTFRRRSPGTRARVRGLKFNLVSVIALGVSYGTFVGLSLAYPDVPPYLPQLIGIVPAIGVNYLLNSHWTFRSGAPAAAVTCTGAPELGDGAKAVDRR